MNDNPLHFKDKKDRNDFFIGILVLLFFGWLFYYFGWDRMNLTDSDAIPQVVAYNSAIDDMDYDGVRDTEDLCPQAAGLAKNNGCPVDTDGDGLNDMEDLCPTLAGKARDKGCPPEVKEKDIDGDGFVGKDDKCPDLAGTVKGCPPDADRDGVPNDEDDCPRKAGPASNNGCPPDADGDGVADGMDKCPKLAGVPENNGCPADDDKDGVYNTKDKCPEVAGVAANNGCPPDADGDGVADANDKCPKVKGTVANGGCPPKVADRDGDGVPDKVDDCPDRAGLAVNKGCPEVKITEAEKKVISEAVSDVVFLPSSANLTDYSKQLVIKIAGLMKKYPEAKLRISGHTDSMGQDADNLVLSQARALACLNLLAAKGVAKNRMISEGFGEAKPIADNSTKVGRQKNRRVEFTLYY